MDFWSHWHFLDPWWSFMVKHPLFKASWEREELCLDDPGGELIYEHGTLKFVLFHGSMMLSWNTRGKRCISSDEMLQMQNAESPNCCSFRMRCHRRHFETHRKTTSGIKIAERGSCWDIQWSLCTVNAERISCLDFISQVFDSGWHGFLKNGSLCNRWTSNGWFLIAHCCTVHYIN